VLSRSAEADMRRFARQHHTAIVLLSIVILTAVGSPAQTATITVAPGDDLQAALDTARPGDVILLEAGASYTGNFRLPAKSGNRYITVRSNADASHFPEQSRVAPEHARWMPTLRSANGAPAIATDPGAHHWRLQWLAFEANPGGVGDIITLGDGSFDGQRDLASVPHHFILDGLVIRGSATAGQKRAIALNSASTIIQNSDIRDIKAIGQDSQAICGWNGPGPYLIENNYLEAAGENVMFGGADPAIRDLVPSDITVRSNYMAKPLAWRAEGSPWSVKNLFELKNARRVLIERNIFEHNWVAAQNGYAVLFTPHNQDGGAPWTVVSDVTFRFNIVRHSASGINLLGADYGHRSEQMRRIKVEHNLFYDIGGEWGGQGSFLQIGNQPAELVFDHNTVLQSGSIMIVYGNGDGRPLPIDDLQFTNNLVFHNDTGIFGDGVGIGNAAIVAYMRRETIRRNVIAGGDASRYPRDNFFPSTAELDAQFVDRRAGDYRLKPSSPYTSAATDGRAVGASVAALRRGMPLSPFASDVSTRPR
jgi:hypothetical protein